MPLPLGPSRPVTVPCSTESDRPSITGSPPRITVSCSTSIAGAWPGSVSSHGAGAGSAGVGSRTLRPLRDGSGAVRGRRALQSSAAGATLHRLLCAGLRSATFRPGERALARRCASSVGRCRARVIRAIAAWHGRTSDAGATPHDRVIRARSRARRGRRPQRSFASASFASLERERLDRRLHRAPRGASASNSSPSSRVRFATERSTRSPQRISYGNEGMSDMWIPAQTTVPPFATARSAAGTSSPAGAKMIAASSSSGGGPPPAHSAPSERANACACSSLLAGDGEDAAALPAARPARRCAPPRRSRRARAARRRRRAAAPGSRSGRRRGAAPRRGRRSRPGSGSRSARRRRPTPHSRRRGRSR